MQTSNNQIATAPPTLEAKAKKGYKCTPIGWIPEEWWSGKIQNLVDLLIIEKPMDGNHGNLHPTASDYVSTGIPFVMANAIKDNRLDLSVCNFIAKNQADSLQKGFSKTGDVLLTHKGTVGATAIVGKIEYPYIMLTPQVTYYRVADSKRLSNKYLHLFFQSTGFQTILNKLSGGGTRAYIGISAQRNLPIVFPPLPEQRKIAEILSTWDKAIEHSQKLVEQLKTRKKGLMQQLLTGQTRLKGFSGEWKEVKIGLIFSEVKSLNDGKYHEPLTISAKLGFVSQKDKFDRVIAGGSLDKYVQLQKDDFSYNKGNSKLYEMGCIYLLEEYDSAVVPFVYISFRKQNQNVNNYFYKHWFANHGLDQQLKAIITSGARGDGLLNVSKKDFFSLKVPFPSLEEQTAIAQVLTAADNEIKTQESYLAQLQAQKKGLMQQLLTGQKRVKI